MSRPTTTEDEEQAVNPDGLIIDASDEAVHDMLRRIKDLSINAVSDKLYCIAVRTILTTNSDTVDTIMDAVRDTPRAYYQLFGSHHVREVIAQRQMYPQILNHYYPIKEKGDGHCLFHCSSFCLSGVQFQHFCLRLVCIVIFVRHFNYFSQIYHRFGCDLATNFRHQIQLTACTEDRAPFANWGDGNHLKAICIASQRHLHIFRPIQDAQQPMMLSQAEIKHRSWNAAYLAEAETYTPFVSTSGARHLCHYIIFH